MELDHNHQVCSFNFGIYHILDIYTPQFNIAPQKSWLEDDPFRLGRLIFRGVCC